MTILIKREVLEIELEWQRRYIKQLEAVLEAAESMISNVIYKDGELPRKDWMEKIEFNSESLKKAVADARRENEKES